ncbi:hypothetical protein KPL70_014067 [Citrus sinensis]|nr:hypothetical protein KPL70_014067 [Citrus sinensis]
MADDRDRTIRDYAVLTPQVVHPGIVRPEVEAANFELKPVMFQMLQTVGQFNGLPTEDPHLYLKLFLELETFYNGLNPSTRLMVDALTNGALLSKSYIKAYEILERIVNNNYQWPSTRQTTVRGAMGVHNIDAITALSAQVTSLTNTVKAMTSVPAAVKQVAELSCVYYGDEHVFDNYPGNPASVNYVGNFNRQPQNNPYSNTYNPGWKQHPNFSWGNQNQNAPTLSGQNINTQPPGFHQQNQGQKHTSHDPLTSFEILIKEYIVKNEAIVQSQVVSLRNLKNQIGQLATAMSSRSQGSLPSNTEDLRREGKAHCKIEDVLVKVDKFIFLVDFIVLDFEVDKEVPIILGRPFLVTGKTLIDVQKGELTMRVNDQQVTFNVLEAMKNPDEVEDYNFLSVLDCVIANKVNRCCSTKVIKVATFESFEEEDTAANQIDWMGERQSNRHSRFVEPLNLSDKEVKTTLPSIESLPTLELKMLPSHLKYAYLGQNNKLHVIISSTLDAGYNQIAIALEDQEKTTFTCPYGTFAFRRMPFDRKGTENQVAEHLSRLEADASTLTKKDITETFPDEQLCVSEEEIPQILKPCHAAAYEGHFGGHRTAAKVLQSEAAALPINDARAVVKFLQKSIFSRFGTPRAIISDEVTTLILHNLFFSFYSWVYYHQTLSAIAMPGYKRTASRLKDPSRFQSYHTEEKYEEFIEPCKILEEKGFQFPPQPTRIVQSLYNVVAKRGWLEFCNHPRDPVLPLVKEFYANLVSPGQHNIWVRNSLVPLDSRVINAFYNLPSEVNCELMPTTHTTTVSQEMLVLLYVIIRGLPIDVGSIIEKEIRDCATKNHKPAALLFLSLITSIYVVSGARLDAKDEHVKNDGVLTARTIERIIGEVTGALSKPAAVIGARKQYNFDTNTTEAPVEVSEEAIDTDEPEEEVTVEPQAEAETDADDQSDQPEEEGVKSAIDSSPAEEEPKRELKESPAKTLYKFRKKCIIQEEDDEPADELHILVLSRKGKEKVITPSASDDEAEQIEAALEAAVARVTRTQTETK